MQKGGEHVDRVASAAPAVPNPQKINFQNDSKYELLHLTYCRENTQDSLTDNGRRSKKKGATPNYA